VSPSREAAYRDGWSLDRFKVLGGLILRQSTCDKKAAPRWPCYFWVEFSRCLKDAIAFSTPALGHRLAMVGTKKQLPEKKTELSRKLSFPVPEKFR
jgi:hypothetical protein